MQTEGDINGESIGMQPVQSQPVGSYGAAGSSHPRSAPVVAQWMERPSVVGVPPGLEYLSQIDQVLAKQKVDVLEAFTDWNEANKYAIYNAYGQQIYYAFEESDTCMRLCCGSRREFLIHIVDNANQEVMRVHRPFNCCASGGCCIPDCCHYEVKVESRDGEPLGYVRSTFGCCEQKFVMLDGVTREVRHNISGPCCICPCCEYNFDISDVNGMPSGIISKKWAGLGEEMFTNADNFGISFPLDLDARMKATMIGAMFLIDFMFFEESKKKDEKNN